MSDFPSFRHLRRCRVDIERDFPHSTEWTASQCIRQAVAELERVELTDPANDAMLTLTAAALLTMAADRMLLAGVARAIEEEG